MNGLGALHDRLHGGLWHMTHPDLFPAVMASGGLTPEPDIDNARRWKTSRGPDYYPFVRKIGGVSLFDFAGFDADQYDDAYRMSTWRTFVPHREEWGGAVWIEINRARVMERFISGDEVVRRWNEGGHHRHTIMPRIEAAHIGAVPSEAFSSAFFTWDSGRRVSEIDLSPFDVTAFGCQLGDWRRSLE